jgi:activator of 2-hydroxyglutaryl-CoA dehydratase
LARCGVVIQSDLIHKQNEGAKREDNLAGLFRTVARNYKIDVLGAREFKASKDSAHAIATGGVLTNDLIRKNLEELLGISITRPQHYHNIAAIGPRDFYNKAAALPQHSGHRHGSQRD